ncbi:unnamed protein product [Brachionus calyciflorus]|uniref:Vesicle tethering protein Uso1/P115-like head domain-containing protein n=1 Tax=Brachionus calyciflorus TaxID=104777 RepID=A0A813TJQ2_9BILA|nr:unnamed protein product [Brachionus calyciflorus]
MSIFGSKLFGFGASSQTGNTNSESSISGAETIERLCDRLTSSLLIEDRHESLRNIKSLSKKYKLEVGTLAMPVLIDVIKQNTTDGELVSLALDTLCNIMNPTSSDSLTDALPADLSHQFTEMFIKEILNLHLLFDLLDEFEFQVRWSSVKLINQLILNQVEQLQDKILQIPRGVSRLIDLLSDSREIIRNDSILILNNLTKTNANIQKIIAFESGFDKIMEIIEGEGNVLDGGVVVEDCFNLLLNLLQTNYSNQSFFKEANYIKKLCKYFDLTGNDEASQWTQQKITNLSLLLKLIRCLVAPNNQQQIINDCQKAFNHFGLLHRLCVILTWPGVPSDLLSQAICTVGEVIRGNNPNQQLFSTVMMQSMPPKPIIIILLLSMINEKQPFHLRSSILYCFECFLYKNEEKKAEIIDTLLPKENVSNQINTGQILCTGLFAPNDFVSNWLCAVALAHTINDNNTLKEQLLRVQLAVNTNSGTVQAVSLLQQCMNILNEASNSVGTANQPQTPSHKYQFQTKISLLMLISTWLSNCSAAVNAFLSNEQNIPYLISQASATDTEDKSLIIQGISSFCLGLSMLYNSNQIEAFTVDKLKDMIKKRIGIEHFEHKLEFISQHEAYTQTLKQPKLAFKSVKSNDLLFDYEFTRLFKSNETLIINFLTNKKILVNGSDSDSKINGSMDNKISHQIEQQNALIIGQYQQIIREQDAKLKEQQQLNQMLTQTCSQLQLSYQDLSSKLGQNPVVNEAQWTSERLQYENKINELEIKCNLLEEKRSEQEDEISKLQREKGILQETINNLETGDKNTEVIELRQQNLGLKKNISQINQEQENLLTLLQEMETKLKNYKRVLKQCGENVSDDEEDGNVEPDEDKTSDHSYDHSNNIASILNSKETSSNDSNILLINNYNNETSSSEDNSKNEHVNSSLGVPVTGENINLVAQDMNNKPFNFLQYFNNPGQTELFKSQLNQDYDLK